MKFFKSPTHMHTFNEFADQILVAVSDTVKKLNERIDRIERKSKRPIIVVAKQRTNRRFKR